MDDLSETGSVLLPAFLWSIITRRYSSLAHSKASRELSAMSRRTRCATGTIMVCPATALPCFCAMVGRKEDSQAS